MVDLVPAIIERMYRDLASAKAPQCQPARVDNTAKKITLTRADVDAILQRKRPASPEDLQHILDHGKELGVSEWDRSQISVDMTIAMAARSRGMNGRREDPNAQFIAQVLGYAGNALRPYRARVDQCPATDRLSSHPALQIPQTACVPVLVCFSCDSVAGEE